MLEAGKVNANSTKPEISAIKISSCLISLSIAIYQVVITGKKIVFLLLLKVRVFKKATKIDKIFTVDLTLTT